ncbi:hypothetical protein RGI145_12400 [Roseomonas gilardii]|uniref:VRR-NUC domain-containing protein n=2 Tax=Roseomonas gilardii TaxID=257708 RepID=A0A1L7AG69_9PROT|nr:hypothetical protein RGI145_12400 [Roseomonas gilardii]
MPRVLLALGRRADVRMFRNTCGVGWTGQVVQEDRATGMVLLQNARRVQFGLAPGSSDLIGVQAVLITPEMVGQTIGRFTAVETKGAKTRVEAHQIAFIETMRRFGAVGGIARSADEALALLTTTSNQGAA